MYFLYLYCVGKVFPVIHVLVRENIIHKINNNPLPAVERYFVVVDKSSSCDCVGGLCWSLLEDILYYARNWCGKV